ncbi:hypothetical protein [Streptomyces avermitilis]|uniref:hypothetical protein n=1 Tax=Streptomyces avermitilis TaxID=33903 RepID=UPI003820130C
MLTHQVTVQDALLKVYRRWDDIESPALHRRRHPPQHSGLSPGPPRGTATVVGVDDSLLRLSIGLEDCDELIADLDRAPASR